MRNNMKTITLLVLMFVCNCLSAQVTMYEQEPNNTPLNGHVFHTPMIILGNMQDKDQDMLIWEVSDVDAGFLWNIAFDGIPDALTKVDVMQLTFTEDGTGVTQVDKLFSINNHGGIATVKKSGLVFSPGTYYLGLSYAGGAKNNSSSPLLGDKLLAGLGEEFVKDNQEIDKITASAQNSYQLQFIKGKKLNSLNTNNNSKENPTSLRDNKLVGLYFDNKTIWLSIEINEKQSQQTWRISGNSAIGQSLTINFYDENGTKKTSIKSDAYGLFSLTDLKLQTGKYLIELISQENVMASLEMHDIGVYIEGQEIEPNDYVSDANQLTLGQTISGQMGKNNEYDYFKFNVSEELSQNHIEINLTNPEKTKLELCLYNADHTKLQCKTNNGNSDLTQLALTENAYIISVARGKADTKYSLDIINKSKKNSLMESEPNDDFSIATAMNEKRIIKGRLSGKEYDYFKFEVGKEPQIWAIQAIGENITNLSLYNAAGKNVQEQRFPNGQKRVRLSNLNLMPGKHIVRVYGEDAQYLLRVFPTGPFDDAMETEPNDSHSQSMLLNFDHPKKGLLQNLTDKDFYRFHLDEEQGIQLTIQAPADGIIQYSLNWEGMRMGRKASTLGGQLEYQGVLQAGDYDLQINASTKVSDDLYRINLNHYDASSCVTDCEPNDNAYQANLIKAPMNLVGRTGTHDDYDWYKLPAFSTETWVAFKTNEAESNTSTRGYINYNKSIQPTFDSEKMQTSFLIPANEESYYKLSNTEDDYNWTVLIDNKEVQAPVIYKDIGLSIQNLPKQVKAYSSQAQNLKAQLIVENSGDKAQSLKLSVQSTDYRWTILIDNKAIEIQPGERMTIPVLIQVPVNSVSNKNTRLTFLAKDEDVLLSSTIQNVQSTLKAELINPSSFWSIDQELLGGINVAATSMGSNRTVEDLAFNVNAVGSNFDQLFDGFTAVGLGMQYRGGRKTEQDYITIELAGNKIIDVKGITLNPLSSVKPNLYLKDFDLHLSTDGSEFQSVLKGQLKSISAEQSFVLDKTFPARFARLYFLSTHDNKLKSNTGLGEWKVIADPSQIISDTGGFNIADPIYGGYVAWSLPENSGNWDINILTEKQEKENARSSGNQDWEWVVGFHNQRAAKITNIQITQPNVIIKEKSHSELLKKVRVFVSRTSNVGPWQLIAEKDLSSAGQIDEIILEKPTWARYVKFSAGHVKARNYGYFPETIKIYEQKVDVNYQSILGEWGELSENAIYEKLNPPQIITHFDDDNNNSKASAIDLSQSKKASGQVQLEASDKPDWYKYITKAGENTLSIELSGKQNVETVILVEDNLGNTVPLIKAENNTNKIVYKIPVKSNKEYYIKVEEPPRSVIFSWDTSGSTSAYHSMILNAISRYSNDVIAGRDSVNFLPFGGSLLMKEWYGNRYFLNTILNNYHRKDNSSAAEKTLDKATKALQNRQGSKSIIVLTDAITGRYPEMWDSFRKVQPRIFSIGIIGNGFGGNPNRQIDLMQSWSRVNNGDFQKVITAAEVEGAFERIANKLRQPADYTLNLSSEYVKEAGPGVLIISQEDNTQSSAVELILDASGSMLKRLNGERRINIAKHVLINAVTEIIPAKTPLALRVFGDKEANACRTDLAIKLKPLDPNSAKSTIEKINAKNLAKTPIADSLAHVASDLKAHKGKKIVILVTDGEETCDGNPEEVIEQLIKDGIDIRLNIVGFAIDDEELKQQFHKWSIQGGGKYFDSNNPESLKNSVSHALKTPFSVFSLSGELIKEGVVNDTALELPAGYYHIKVFGSDVISFENYLIKGDSEQTIEL